MKTTAAQNAILDSIRQSVSGRVEIRGNAKRSAEAMERAGLIVITRESHLSGTGPMGLGSARLTVTAYASLAK